MYSVLIFEYFGSGNFAVKCYKNTATSIISPTIEPAEFFADKNLKHLRMDEFIFGRNNLKVESDLRALCYNAVQSDPDVFKIEVSGIENRNESQVLVLEKELETLYKNWKGMDKIFFTLWKRMWQIDVGWDNEHCILANGWNNFLEELEISTGDVIAMNIANSPDIVLICIFKQQELSFEREEGEKNERRSFYKFVSNTTLKHGYVVLPALIGEKTEKNLCAVEKILIYENEWQIRYNQKFRIIYGLDKVIEHYNLMFLDIIHFSFGWDGMLCGRIFRRDGMEIMYSTSESSCTIETHDDFFLLEDDHIYPLSDMDPNGDVNMTNVVENVEPIVIEDLEPGEMGNVVADMIENEEEALVYQFSKRLITCNMNTRCHGMHIPATMRFQNRDWERGDSVTFRTALGSWNIRIVLNHGKARFSGGWSKFVRENKLKINDNLRFTLREEADNAVFDIEVNPRD